MAGHCPAIPSCVTRNSVDFVFTWWRRRVEQRLITRGGRGHGIGFAPCNKEKDTLVYDEAARALYLIAGF